MIKKEKQKASLTEDSSGNQTSDIPAENQAPDSVTNEGELPQESDEAASLREENDKILRQVAELQDRYLRLAAEFDNYRKRTLKEKSELIQTAGEEMLKNILPVIDDFDRSLQIIENSTEVEGLRQGVLLIHAKFKDFLHKQGVKEMVASGEVFNADVHEALTTIPTPEKRLKGKVVDVVQKGYLLNDKIIRFAKVVVGQ